MKAPTKIRAPTRDMDQISKFASGNVGSAVSSSSSYYSLGSTSGCHGELSSSISSDWKLSKTNGPTIFNISKQHWKIHEVYIDSINKMKDETEIGFKNKHILHYVKKCFYFSGGKPCAF